MQFSKLIWKFTFVVALAVFGALIASSSAMHASAAPHADPAGTQGVSEGFLERGQAEIFYLYHCGWAVKTSSALMIFDYWDRMERPEQPSLANGFVDPEEIKDQNVYVFISHGHGDHFDERILAWRRVIPKITYVFGWPADEAEEDVVFGKDRGTEVIGPMTVKNIFHDFDGIPESAFLIEVDSLTIYFSGDHGNAPGALHPVYKDNIDYMAKQAERFDLVFLSIFGGPTYDGELYAIDNFKPKVIFPMHYGSRETNAKSFVDVAQAKFPDVKFWYPLKQGDKFSFKK